MIRAVTFDFWNTLLREREYSSYRIGVLTQTLNEEGSPRNRSRVEAEYSSAIEFFLEVWMKERRHLPTTKLTEFVLGRLDVHLSTEAKDRLVKRFEEAIFTDPPPLVEDAEMVLKSLYGRCKIGLISNSGVTPGRNLRQVLEQHAILQYFWCAVFSDELGYHKPHPAIFRRAISELQVNATEAMHVGDSPESDISGAKAMGMKTVWFNESGRKRQTNGLAPDYEIGALSELLEILKE